MSPPLDKESLDSKIKELSEKHSAFEKEGELRLKEEEDKLAEGTLEEEDHHYERRERNGDDEDYPRRGGRGGRGGFRGTRGGRGGYRGGSDRPQTEGGRGRGGMRERE